MDNSVVIAGGRRGWGTGGGIGRINGDEQRLGVVNAQSSVQ